MWWVNVFGLIGLLFDVFLIFCGLCMFGVCLCVY